MQGIPALVLLDENDEVITSEGRTVVVKDQEGKVSSDSVLLVETNADVECILMPLMRGIQLALSTILGDVILLNIVY